MYIFLCIRAPRRLYCDWCRSSFFTNKKLTLHKHLKHRGEMRPLHKCFTCSYSTLSRTHLMEHEASAHYTINKRGVFSCKSCTYVSRIRANMSKHIKLMHGLDVKSRGIPKKGSAKSGAVRLTPKRSYAYESSDKPFKCSAKPSPVKGDQNQLVKARLPVTPKRGYAYENSDMPFKCSAKPSPVQYYQDQSIKPRIPVTPKRYIDESNEKSQIRSVESTVSKEGQNNSNQKGDMLRNLLQGLNKSIEVSQVNGKMPAEIYGDASDKCSPLNFIGFSMLGEGRFKCDLCPFTCASKSENIIQYEHVYYDFILGLI